MATLLFTTYYPESVRSRLDELDTCLKINLSLFDRVYVLSETMKAPDWFTGKWIIMDRRQNYSHLLDLATKEAKIRDIVVLANCDIIIPTDLIKKNLRTGEAYCLTRWDITPRGIKLWEVGYSQDVWCFKGKPKPDIGGDYWFGIPGCDNRFAYELYEAGYDVANPSRDIHTFHLHLTNYRTQTNTRMYRTLGKYLHIRPAKLNETPKIEIQNRV